MRKKKTPFVLQRLSLKSSFPPPPFLPTRRHYSTKARKKTQFLAPLLGWETEGWDGSWFFWEKRRRRRAFGIGSRTLLFFCTDDQPCTPSHYTLFSPQSLSAVVPRKPDFFSFLVREIVVLVHRFFSASVVALGTFWYIRVDNVLW